MTTPYFIYNSINSSSLGLQIEQMSSLPVPARKYEYTDIPGADGQLVRDYGAYEDVQIEVRFNCMRNNAATPATLNAWLTGTGTLIHFDAPTYYYRVKAVQMPTRYRYRPWGKNYDSISVIFFCEPYRYLLNPTAITRSGSSSGSMTVSNSYNAEAHPLIVISGTNPMALSMSGNTLSIAATAATIDTDAGIVYNGTTPLNAKTVLTGDWPKLSPGSNAVAWTGITSLRIEPRWREL